MRQYLIVANQTLASPALREAIIDRAGSGPSHFHVVVPATPVQHGLTWDEEESNRAAAERLGGVLAMLEGLGLEASGEVGCKDPVAAVHDTLRDRTADEVILSTLPVGISRWLGQDVPSRLRATVGVPVTVVVAPRAVGSTAP